MKYTNLTTRLSTALWKHHAALEFYVSRTQKACNRDVQIMVEVTLMFFTVSYNVSLITISSLVFTFSLLGSCSQPDYMQLDNVQV